MNHSPAAPEERYAALVEALAGIADVTFGASGKKGFGSTALWSNGKIFAMLSHDRLVVKLPRQRVDALIAAGAGERFDPGHGRRMKEWFSLAPTSEEQWLPLACEALAFVAAKG